MKNLTLVSIFYYLSALFIASFSQASYAAKVCHVVQQTCVEGAGIKKIGGYEVFRDCWRLEKQYQCQSSVIATTNDCATFRGQGCYEMASDCLQDGTDDCAAAKKTYRCDINPAKTEHTSCAVKTFCMDGTCFDTGYSADKDMAQVIGNLEAVREAGRYFDPEKGVFFDGNPEHCREGWGGLKSCCDIETEASAGRPSTSNQVAFETIMTTAKYGYDYAKFKATPYVQDVIAQAKAMVSGAQATSAATSTAAAGSGAAAAAPAFNFSFMGFGWTSGAVAQTSTMGVQSTSLGNGFYFNPLAFGLAIAVMLVMEAMSCKPEEQQLGVKRGNSLCFQVGGDYCSKEVLGACTEESKGFCCFNSKLAKIINYQGKQQIGVSLGTAENPNCGGFNLEEFQKLDLGKMDLSEFLKDIIPDEYSREGVHEDEEYWQERAKSRVDKATATQSPDVSYDPTTQSGVTP